MSHGDDNRIARDPLGELIHAAGRRPPPPREDYERVLAASRVAWQNKVRSRKRRRWYALAASLAIISGTAAVLLALQPMTPVPVAAMVVADGNIAFFSDDSGTWEPLPGAGTELLAGSRLRAGADGRAALAMSGGGSLRINASTEVLLGERGVVELASGMLYFDSESREGADAIEIVTPFGVVRDIGTQFEVRSTPSSLRVRVRTGEVELRSPLAAEFQSSAGREFELSANGALQLGEIAPDDDDWAWTAALAVAPATQGGSVLGYLQWIARESGKSLEFDSPNTELGAQFVSWNADTRGLTPLQVLDSIAATSDFIYELRDDGAILIRRREQ